MRNATLRFRTSSSGERTASGNTHPRVEPGVDEVDERIDQDDEEGCVHYRRHDHRKVEILQRVVRQLPDAVEPEDDLCQQSCTTDKRTEVEAEEADEDDHDMRSECRSITRRSVSPFARAVRT